jgi:hypothetical protein
MGSNDNLSISYHSADWSDVQYGEWNGSGFDVEVAAEDDWPYGLVSLALEADGTPHIAYTDGQIIRYASWNGTSWDLETVDSDGKGDRISLALDSMENPWITYSGGDNDLILAHLVPEPALLAGDANCDGVVSASDYASVQASFGNTGVPGIHGDANGDGVVSAGDYASVQANFGNTAPAQVSNIPEPGMMSLLLIGGLAMLKRRRS